MLVGVARLHTWPAAELVGSPAQAALPLLDHHLAMSTPQRSVVPPTSTHQSYHPGGYGVSEGLKRARRPFIVRNIVTGGAIAAFAVSVYWYSISKVSAFTAIT